MLPRACNCFSRSEQLVVVRDQSIRPVLSSVELTGLLNQHVEFYFVSDDCGEYKPLPSAYANTWLNNAGQRERLPVIKLFSRNPVYTDDWRLIATTLEPSELAPGLTRADVLKALEGGKALRAASYAFRYAH